jgi:tRNA (guanine-N7-)-methyltransferase
VGKNKLERWAELGTFNNVIQHDDEAGFGKDHPVKGRWNIDIFKNQNPVILELGCGRGEYTTALAARFPSNNYIGVDIKGARLWRGAKTAHVNRLKNAAFLRSRIEFINSFFAGDEVDEIWLTFPDPQPEKKNSNKKLTCPWFLNNYRKFLKDKGIIHLKTDNSDLFRYTRNIAERNNLEIIASTTDLYSEFKEDEILNITTHYEEIYLNEGMKINYLAFRLEKSKTIGDAITQAVKG